MSRAAWCGRTALIVCLFVIGVPIGTDAQSTASISGVVKDTDGAVLPGVSVVIKNDTSGQSQDVTTDAEGRYQATALGAGSYTVSATLSGFKVATAKSVRVAPGQPVTIPLTLEIGQLEETVIVTSSSELINTENGTVSATLNSDQLMRMPTPTRNALNAVAFLPGVNTTGTNRDSTINGLPESFVSITLDGVSNNDNFLRNTDAFFASVTPRQDAVEAVSVTLSAAGAQVGGGAGAVTMAFQTRSGGNRFTGSAYEYYRNPSFNTNYVFNEINHLAKNDVKLNQFGARAGGPIVIPGLVRRPQQGLLLRALRADPLPEQLHSHSDSLQFTDVRRLFPLPVRQRGARGQPAPAGGRQRADRHDRSDQHEPAANDRRRDEDHRHARRAKRSAVRQLRLAEPVGALRAPADRADRLQRHRQPPAERLVRHDHVQANARLLEQCRSAVSGRPEPARLRLQAAAAVHGPAVRDRSRTWSTSCAAG